MCVCLCARVRPRMFACVSMHANADLLANKQIETHYSLKWRIRHYTCMYKAEQTNT